MKKAIILSIITGVLLCACSVKKHAVLDSEQHTSDFRLQTGLQTKVFVDSVLQSISMRADSVVIIVTPSAQRVGEEIETTTIGNSVLSSPQVKITAYNPQASSTKERNNLAIVQTVERDSTAGAAHFSTHADNSKEVVNVAKPMNGTVVIVLLAVLLVVAIVLLLYLHKRKII